MASIEWITYNSTQPPPPTRTLYVHWPGAPAELQIASGNTLHLGAPYPLIPNIGGATPTALNAIRIRTSTFPGVHRLLYLRTPATAFVYYVNTGAETPVAMPVPPNNMVLLALGLGAFAAEPDENLAGEELKIELNKK